jgi:hypothetical protein
MVHLPREFHLRPEADNAPAPDREEWMDAYRSGRRSGGPLR